MSKRVYFTCKTVANGYCSANSYVYQHGLQAAWVQRVVASQALQANDITGISTAQNQPTNAIIVA